MIPLRVALIQMGSGIDPERNIEDISARLAELPPSDAVLLPEVCLLRGGHEDVVRGAEPIPGDRTRALGALARRHSVYLLAGSLPEREGDACYNTSVLFNRKGGIEACYRKMNLFECVLPDGTRLRESDVYRPGHSPVLSSVDEWTVGLSVCYDLRFPSLYGRYAARGAAAMFIPSDFTAYTGRAHWHTLVRARAIETQSYVLAVNQCGANACTGVVSYGHSLIVSPWGDVLAEAGDGPGALTASLDPGLVERVRSSSPVLARLREEYLFPMETTCV